MSIDDANSDYSRAFETAALPGDLQQLETDYVWTWAEQQDPPLRAMLEERIRQSRRVQRPKDCRPVRIGQHYTYVLPAYTAASLRVERMWSFNVQVEENRRTWTPPLQEFGTAFNVALTLGTFMDIGRVAYDQLPFSELKYRPTCAACYQDYTAVNSLDQSEDGVAETAAIQRDLHAALLTEIRGDDQDIPSELDAPRSPSPQRPNPTSTTSHLSLAEILDKVLDTVRQVSYTTVRTMLCTNRGCSTYAPDEPVHRWRPLRPSWTQSRRPRSMSHILDSCFSWPEGLYLSSRSLCGGCARTLVPVWTILDGPPLRLLLTNDDFTSDELAFDKLREIEFGYLNPARVHRTVSYRWFAIIFRDRDADSHWVVINRGDGMYYCYAPKKNFGRVMKLSNVETLFSRQRNIIARVYQQCF